MPWFNRTGKKIQRPKLCPNCGLNADSQCQCYQEYIENQFPFFPSGDDAYSDAQPYTPYVDNTKKPTKPKPPKKGLLG